MLVSGSRWMREAPGIVVAVVATVCYLKLVSPFVLGGDSGEFALLAHVDGIAHPPGYPLYVLILRIFSWMPAASPAQAAGLVTALIAGLQLLVLYGASRCWGATPLAAAMAMGFYAGSPLSIQHFTHAEVFALNGLIVAGLLLCCSPFFVIAPMLRLASISLLCGLGLSHHHSFVLVTPVIVFGLLSGFRDLLLRRRFLWALWLPIFFVIGLLPNALLFTWSQSGDVYFNSWSVIRTWPDFWHHWLRRDYGTFSLASEGNKLKIGVWSHMVELGIALDRSWKFLLPVVLLPFAHELPKFRLRSRSSWAWITLLMSFIMVGPVFFSRANIDPYTLVGGEVVERFYLLPNLLLVIPVGVGIGLLGRWLLALLRRFSPLAFNRQSSFLQAIVFVVIAVYAFAFNAIISVRDTSVRRHSNTEDFARNGLESLPENAIVFMRSDDAIFASNYLQYVRGVRPDVTILVPGDLGKRWYFNRVHRKLNDCQVSRLSHKRILQSFVAYCKRPVFVDSSYYFTAIPKNQRLGLPNYQFGIYRRILSSGSEKDLPVSDRLLALNQSLFAKFRVPARQVSLAHGWASHPFYVYAGAWQALAADLDKESRPDLARIARLMQLRYGPCLKGGCLSD